MKDDPGKKARETKGETPGLPRLDNLVERAQKLARRYRVRDGKGFRLKDVDPGDTAWLKAEDKPRRQGGAAAWASSRSPSCRTCSTRRTAGPCS